MRQLEPNTPQLGLFGPRARAADPETSHEAAASVAGVRESQQKVLRILTESGAMTDEQLQQAMRLRYPGALSESGVRTRRKELCDAGLIEDSGHRRRLDSGRRAIVWAVVQR